MELKIENVKRVYSGKPGCMCGCRGKYSEEGRGVKTIFNKILKGEYKVDKVANCIYLDTDSRTLVAYFS
jgi:hypothetical protein